MKKLMIVAAVICAAVASQAASVIWDNGDGDVYLSDGSSAKASGYTAYFFTSADLTSTVLGEFAKKDFTNLSKGFEAPSLSDGGWLEDGDGFDVASFVGGTDGTGVLVIFDAASASAASNFYVTPSVTETIAVGTGMNTSFTFDASGSESAAAWTSIAPEPTSGLLLLIGMAGLALKRKRA